MATGAWSFFWLCNALLYCVTSAGDDYRWLSPVYDYFFQYPLPFPPEKPIKYSYTNATTNRTINYFEIEIKPFQQQVYPNLGKANLVGYDGVSPGPTFRMDKNTEAVIRFINHATHDSAVHLHGSFSRTPFDGWAEDTIKPGEYKDYYYPNAQPGRTLWYHDHAMHHTAENAYSGQAGFYILNDPSGSNVLPTGKYDIPLALASKQYKSNGDLFSPASERRSLYGDVIQVNGQPWPFFEVEPRKYRLRFLDTSVSRAFDLYFADDEKSFDDDEKPFEDDERPHTKLPFQVVGSDAGLLSRPITSTGLEIAMAERWEVVFDFANFVNKNITLRNNRQVQTDEDYAGTNRVMRFVVGNTVSNFTNNGPVPSPLNALDLPPVKTDVDHIFKFGRKGGEGGDGEWTINGVTFSDVKNRVLAKPPRGKVELWQLENHSGGWSHPVHMHLVDLQIVSRTHGRRTVLEYEAAALKDVVLLGVGEKVQVLAKYAPWDGVYMFHCHNLIHEDHDMMAVFNVTALKDFGYSERTRFLDPMEERWRAKKENTAEGGREYIEGTLLPMFDQTQAYSRWNETEEALDEYWAKHGGVTRNSADSGKRRRGAE